jgi:hypothetical protein
MVFELLRLQFLKGIRSVALTRNIIGGIVIGFIAFILLMNLMVLAFALPSLLESTFNIEDPMQFMNSYLLFFFLTEIMYRFFIQKMPVIELENFLHLPIKRSKIVHFLLTKSLVTPLSVVALICFGPFSYLSIESPSSWSWLMAILATSFTLHWLMLWYKQKFGDHLSGMIALFAGILLLFAANYYGFFNAGSYAAPFFEWALQSFWPAFILLTLSIASYGLAYNYHINHSYVEELGSKTNIEFANRSVSFFARFGLAGEIADLEWKLILRHKKSRTYLFFSVLFLLYGLLFYNDPTHKSETGFSYLYIFIGTFITGSFIAQYGQLFLSWNSKNFDFYLTKRNGIHALIKGKYLLFFVISAICFFLSVPYVYFGWEILLVHFATFLFNMGISIHAIIYLSLWKPKPMNLDKGGMFNYEGMGVAQFLIAIPLIALPFLVFLPPALLAGDYVGLLALGITGIIGLFFFEPLSDLAVKRLNKSSHQISQTFRQEL